MIRFILYAFILFLAIVSETIYIKIPLTLTALFIIAVVEKRGWILCGGLVAGLLVDSLTFRLIGESSLFFLIVLFVFHLYGRKFEIEHIGFDTFFCLIASTIYGILFDNQQPFIAAIIASMLAGSVLLLLQLFKKRKRVGYQ